jgi:two-component system NtrC family sensor kinase
VLIGIVLPLTVLTVYFHFKNNSSIKDSSKLVLNAFSESLGNTIDLFLEERILNLFSLFHRSDFTVLPTNDRMQFYFEQLTKVSAASIDLQYLDSRVEVLASAGILSTLTGPLCNDQDPAAIMGLSAKEYMVSNICRLAGSESVAAIAVRQILDGRAYAFRSLIDLDSLDTILQNIRQVDMVEFGLRYRNGNFWNGQPDPGQLMDAIDNIRSWDGSSIVVETQKNGDLLLTTRTRLYLAPWTLLVQRNVSVANSGLRHHPPAAGFRVQARA